MLERVRNLRNRYRTATDEEKKQIDAETQALQEEDLEAWQDAMLKCMKETNKELSNILVREQLNEILPYISISTIAKNYFGKSKAWFYQRMNGNIVNGKPAQFTAEEIEKLNFALQDLSKKLSSIKVV